MTDDAAEAVPVIDGEVYQLGRFTFSDGTTPDRVWLAYQTYGELARSMDNVVVVPTSFITTHHDFDWLIGPGRPLDTRRHFVVVVNLFGNGLSFSPSNAGDDWRGPKFPMVSVQDNVRAQFQLLRDRFDVGRVELVVGSSMGAMHAFEWGYAHGDIVRRIAPIGGTASTREHGRVFTMGAEAVLRADRTVDDPNRESVPVLGLRGLGRFWAGWACSQRFYSEGHYRRLGYASPEEFVHGHWDPWFAQLNADNALTQLATWRNWDLAAGGDLGACLASIRPRALVMAPGKDLYFPVWESEEDAGYLSNAEFRVIPGEWGHFCLSGLEPASADYMCRVVSQFLRSDAEIQD